MTAVEAKIRDAQARRTSLAERLSQRKQAHRAAEASFMRSIEQCIQESLDLLRQEDELADLVSQAVPALRAEQAPLVMQSYRRWLEEAGELVPSVTALGEDVASGAEFKRAMKRVRVLLENTDRMVVAAQNIANGKGLIILAVPCLTD